MKHPRLRKLIKSAQATSGFSENGPEKQQTRFNLIQAANERSSQRPMTVFSFPGILGFCVEAFRAAWPAARIIGIDRQMPAIRFTRAHRHTRETVIGQIENELLHGALKDYSERNAQRLYRVFRSGDKERLTDQVPPFDFPKFDVMFLDTTARYDTNTGVLVQAARMIDEHCAPGAVIGVTVVLGGPKAKLPELEPIVDQFRRSITRETTLIDAPMAYFTKLPMLFFMLEVT